MVKKVLISELVDAGKMNIIGGQITSRVEAKYTKEKIGSIKVLLPKAISNGSINQDELGTLDLKTEIDKKRITKAGDIVIKLSTPYDACIITEEEEGLLVPSFCAIINNVPDSILKEYLLAYLNSQACLLQIQTLFTGTTIPILSIGQIKKLYVPLPDEEGDSPQYYIAKKYMEGVEKNKLLEKVMRLEKEYLDSMFFEMEGYYGNRE
jgi:restriction endonuclease S subunit